MSVQDVTEALGIHYSTVYRWVSRGLLKATYGYAHTARRYSFDADDVSTFITTVGGLISDLKPSREWEGEVKAAQDALQARYIAGAKVMEAIARPHQQLA